MAIQPAPVGLADGSYVPDAIVPSSQGDADLQTRHWCYVGRRHHFSGAALTPVIPPASDSSGRRSRSPLPGKVALVSARSKLLHRPRQLHDCQLLR